jgi:hypothetical protein
MAFLRPNAQNQFPEICPESFKRDILGTPGCMVYDNLMRFQWDPKGIGEKLKDPKDWFVHIIPQHSGSLQPEMEKYLHDGDIAVYWHPETRDSSSPGALREWRSSHAATILKNPAERRVLTIDTPTGYAKPFNGLDATPFHVFRFIPEGDLDWDVIDEYGKQIAKWGTLGFDKFRFNGNYATMGKTMRKPSDIDVFASGYIERAAQQSSSFSDPIPSMYCAFFAWTNLNLAWMRPMTPNGLGAKYADLDGKTFSGLRPTHQFAQGSFDEGYKVSGSLADKMSAKQSFAIEPMTYPDLVVGFLDRVVGELGIQTSAPEFVTIAKLKAAVLQKISQDPNVGSKFFSEPGRGITDEVSKKYNDKVKLTLEKLAQLYDRMAEVVMRGGKSPKDAVVNINAAVESIIKQQWLEYGEISNRFIPPYGFVYHAENMRYSATANKYKRPVLAYVGTVIHEKYLRKKGEEIGVGKTYEVPAAVETAEDRANDALLYQIMNCHYHDDMQDGQAWKTFLDILTNNIAKNCDLAKSADLVRLNESEVQAVRVMLADWNPSLSRPETNIVVRNKFGLDAVLMRRLLISYWNDPTQHFKPAIYEGSGSSIDSAVVNLRILLQDYTEAPKASQSAAEQYNTVGHPRRKSNVPCLIGLDGLKAGVTTCSEGVWMNNF